MIRRGSFLSRLLALALLVVAGLVVWAVIGQPVMQRVGGLQERIADATQLRDRFAKLAAEKDQAEAEVKAARAAVEKAGLRLQATSDTLAAAEMRERLNDIVKRYGGELRSVRVTPPEDVEGKGRSIGMRVAMRGGFQSLFSVLYAVEADAPYYYIDSAEIKARRVRRRRNQEVERDEILEMRFDVTAYMQPAGGS